MSGYEFYYNPEKCGMTLVGTIDFSSGSYEFDYLTVWREDATGKILYAEDSGCSCPAPFEGLTREAMTEVQSEADLKSRLDFRVDEASRWYERDGERLKEDVRGLLARLKEVVV